MKKKEIHSPAQNLKLAKRKRKHQSIAKYALRDIIVDQSVNIGFNL